MKPWVRVLRFCESVGVEMPIGPIPGGFGAPFTKYLGLDWDRKILYVRGDGVERPLVAGQMIHEVGHMVATLSRPDDSDELTFTAWEWRAAIECGVRREWWRFAMKAYETGEGDAFGDLGTHEQLAFMRRRMVAGRAIGNVSPSGRPVSLR